MPTGALPIALLLAAAGGAAPGDPPVAPPPPAPPAATAVVLDGARVLPVSGPPIPRGRVVIRGGRIEAVGADTAVPLPEGARVLDLSGRTLCPGFVDGASRAALSPSDRAGGPRDPETAAADGFDPASPALAAALRAGVTSLVLSPGAPRGTFAGRLALVKTAGSGVADREGAVKAVLSPPGPGSSLDRAGAAEALRAAFRGAGEHRDAKEKYAKDLREFLAAAAKHGAAGDALEETILPAAVAARIRRLDPEPREAARKALRARLGLKEPEKPVPPPKRPGEPRENPSRDLLLACMAGEVGVRFEAHAEEDLRAALSLAAEFRLKASIEGGGEAAAVASDIAKAKVAVACWPVSGPGPDPAGPPASAVPAALAAAGASAAVATGDAGPMAVRHLPLLAARAAGQGLTGERALRAVTLDAAAAAGFGRRIGSIEPGKDADLLVVDGDPLDPDARIVAVWVDGVEAWAAAAPGGGR